MSAEKNFENRIKDFLTEQGCWFVKYFANGFTKAGIPDILCCCKGYFVAIEVKASNGHPTLLQIDKLEKIDDAGGFSILLYPKDFELFKSFIELLSKNDDLMFDEYYHFKGVIDEWKKRLLNSCSQ